MNTFTLVFLLIMIACILASLVTFLISLYLRFVKITETSFSKQVIKRKKHAERRIGCEIASTILLIAAMFIFLPIFILFLDNVSLESFIGIVITCLTFAITSIIAVFLYFTKLINRDEKKYTFEAWKKLEIDNQWYKNFCDNSDDEIKVKYFSKKIKMNNRRIQEIIDYFEEFNK
ncbi:hypothetical protein CXP39_01345 [Mesoplasma syrphidae]|uniref:Uncharacterized protein n=1 Tax=Mesoplasma syrphidae TaxID=225999 RepID=A0A2K9C584_9MOLU|nr:hypothetical protein [Mesoplasma syrphidae]AUF83447.1 hypothetical protein CXP39_01345 [Mesoplasma syrphidae]